MGDDGGLGSRLGAKGFRPFFLLAGAFAVVVVPLWVGSLSGGVIPAGPLGGAAWHAHEMLFGYTVAVVAGFLLTAVENWTGRPTLRGGPLLGLAAIWAAARVGCWFPGWPGAVLDLAFLPLVALGIGRPLVATRNLRNLPFVVLLVGLWLADLAVWLDAFGVRPGLAPIAHRVAVHLVAVIILVVTGRVVPMFTRNATGDATLRNLPALDRLAIGSTLALTALQVGPPSGVRAAIALVAGAATLGRMWGWWTPAVARQPLLWVLHLGHAAVGLGLGLSALPGGGTGPLHLLTVGGIGLLTVGMMARVSLGHTGRPLQIGRSITLAFAAVAAAALARALGPWLDPSGALGWWWFAAAAWSSGFGLFVAGYLPILTAPRVDGKPG